MQVTLTDKGGTKPIINAYRIAEMDRTRDR